MLNYAFICRDVIFFGNQNENMEHFFFSEIKLPHVMCILCLLNSETKAFAK